MISGPEQLIPLNIGQALFDNLDPFREKLAI